MTYLCEICGGNHPTEVHPKPNPQEIGETAERSFDEMLAQASERCDARNGATDGQPRKRKPYERRLAVHTMPTEEKEAELQSRGKRIKTVVVFDHDTLAERSEEIDPEIGEMIKKAYRIIRDKFPDQGAKDEHYLRLDAALAGMVARYHPSKKVLAGSTVEARFVIDVKEGELPEFSDEEYGEAGTSEEGLGGAIELLKAVEAAETTAPDLGKIFEGVSGAGLVSDLPLEKPKIDMEAKMSRLGRATPEMRRLALQMQNAHMSGEWSDDLIDDYVRLMDRLPQYIHHRLAFFDLLARAKRGELVMPKTLISVASGPQEEARAQFDLAALTAEFGFEQINIFNADLSQRMLSRGAAAYREKINAAKNQAQKDFPEPVQARAYGQMLPLKDAAADFVECSSLDSLKDPADVFLTLSEMARVAKPGGHLRVVFRRRLPDIFFEAFERDLGVKLLTKPHSTLGIPSELYQNLKAAFGRNEAARLRKQAGAVEYILAQRTGDAGKAIGLEGFGPPAVPTSAESPISIEAFREIARKRTNVEAYRTQAGGKTKPVESVSVDEVVPASGVEPAPAATPPRSSIELRRQSAREAREQKREKQSLLELERQIDFDRLTKTAKEALALVDMWDKKKPSPFANATRTWVLAAMAESLKSDHPEVVLQNGEIVKIVGPSAEAIRRANVASGVTPITTIVKMLPRQQRLDILARHAPQLMPR